MMLKWTRENPGPESSDDERCGARQEHQSSDYSLIHAWVGDSKFSRDLMRSDENPIFRGRGHLEENKTKQKNNQDSTRWQTLESPSLSAACRSRSHVRKRNKTLTGVRKSKKKKKLNSCSCFSLWDDALLRCKESLWITCLSNRRRYTNDRDFKWPLINRRRERLATLSWI
jgi:hypothetical protein